MTNIIYLGPQGSYTEVAVDKMAETLNIKDFNKTIKSSITEVIETIDSNSSSNNETIGVIPVENSIEGIVRETIDTLVKTTSRVVIKAEIVIPISHCLISNSDNPSKIKTVLSHPQALAQCKNYLLNKFNNKIEKVSTTSTSDAVKQLTELDDTFAAIGTSKAAEIYNFKILEQSINDEKDNVTRFICLGSSATKPTGNDKSTMAFSANNKAGALVDVLNVFRDNNINLSYIESRPSKKVFGEYTFFIDFDGHIEEEHIQKAIGKIAPRINFYRLLGSYPKYK